MHPPSCLPAYLATVADSEREGVGSGQEALQLRPGPLIALQHTGPATR